jgi:4-hydroxybenzoate polyprenyltransferase
MSEYVQKLSLTVSVGNINAVLKGTFEICQKILTFLMVSSLFIATTGFFETYVGYVLLGINASFSVCLAVLLMTFSIYSLDKITDSDEDIINMPERGSFLVGRRKLVLYCSLASFALSLILIYWDQPSSVLIMLFPLIANVFYGTRIHPKMPRLKDIPVVKNFVVAISWALITTLLPAAHVSGMTNVVVLVFYFMFVKVFINAILYDIRDVRGDVEMGVRTMPVLLGTRNTTLILVAINCTLLPWLAYVGPSLRTLAALMVIHGFAYIIYFRKPRSAIALDLFVDGQWMIVVLIFLLLKGLGIA